MPQPLHNVQFLQSASEASQLGPAQIEVAFVGRSNVGKSSLLNALCHHRQLARVSRTPGRTRLINVFAAGPGRWIVDLPGYGFASGPESERRKWRGMIESYLSSRPSLSLIFVLVDAEVGPTKLDFQMLDWLRSVGLPARIVATKADQVKPSRSLSQRRDLAASLGLQPSDIAWVSSSKGTGIPELRQEVARILEIPAS